MAPASARRATWGTTAVSGGARTPAAGEDTARRGSASAKTATRAPTARQVGRGLRRAFSKLTGGGKRDGREGVFHANEFPTGLCSFAVQESRFLESVTTDEADLRGKEQTPEKVKCRTKVGSYP